jgi:integrase
MAISAIRRRQVAELMDHIESTAGSSVADRVHEQLSIFFRWYAERDDEFASSLVRPMKRHPTGPGARAMTDDELRQFWSACNEAGIAGAAGRMCLLTATRRDETTKAKWSELSGERIWTIPSDRCKTAREHIVPLSEAALAVLSELDKASSYLFSITDCAPDSWCLWTTIMEVGGFNGDGLSWHSLRKTARTLMSQAGVRSDHSERALGHVQGAVERAYDKHDYLAEKQAAFEALAAEVDRIIGQQSEANVLQLNAA